MQYLENINKIDFLFLTNIYEPGDNELLLEVKGGLVANEERDVYVTAEKSIKAHSVSIDNEAPYYSLFFDNYVAYQVLNESFAAGSEKDVYEMVGPRRRLVVFSESGYMDYILKETFADDIFPGEMKHYGIFTEDHVVHVIAFKDPLIEMKMPEL